MAIMVDHVFDQAPNTVPTRFTYVAGASLPHSIPVQTPTL